MKNLSGIGTTSDGLLYFRWCGGQQNIILEVHILVYFVKSNKLVVDLELPALCDHWEIDDKTGISKGDPASLIGCSTHSFGNIKILSPLELHLKDLTEYWLQLITEKMRPISYDSLRNIWLNIITLGKVLSHKFRAALPRGSFAEPRYPDKWTGCF